MKHIFATLFLVGFLGSCSSDVLNLTDPNRITTQTFWQSENDVLSALTATYNLLFQQHICGDRAMLIYNGRGDDFFIRNDMQAVYQTSVFTNTPDNSEVQNLFSRPYQMIFRCNQIIDNVGNMSVLSDAQKASYIGEAQFFRAFAYFLLAANFGDVPLIISVPQNKDEYFVKQSLAKEVWEQAKADFKAASETLPIAYSSEFTGRATQGAALAYLGKACLYTNDWEGVITALTPLTKSPYTYKLVDNFGDNFVIATENNEESIFEVQFKDIPGASFPNGFSARMVAPAEAQGWYELFPTNKLFDAFQKEKTVDGELDPRMYATLVWKYEGAMFYNRPFESLVLPFPQFKSWLKKYQNYDRDTESIGLAGSLNMMDNNERIMRYDYVLMMLAEAHTMKNQLSEAHTYLKQIRTRAKLDENKTASYNREQMMAEIQHQSMLEFARENQRFYDLRRWGILKQELLNSDKEGKEFYVEGKHDFFPIPQSEINANPAIEQNPYW